MEYQINGIRRDIYKEFWQMLNNMRSWRNDHYRNDQYRNDQYRNDHYRNDHYRKRKEAAGYSKVLLALRRKIMRSSVVDKFRRLCRNPADKPPKWDTSANNGWNNMPKYFVQLRCKFFSKDVVEHLFML